MKRNIKPERKAAKRLVVGTPEYERLANAQARNFAPPIRQCKACSYPYVDGYCCNNCGDTR